MDKTKPILKVINNDDDLEKCNYYFERKTNPEAKKFILITNKIKNNTYFFQIYEDKPHYIYFIFLLDAMNNIILIFFNSDGKIINTTVETNINTFINTYILYIVNKNIKHDYDLSTIIHKLKQIIKQITSVSSYFYGYYHVMNYNTCSYFDYDKDLLNQLNVKLKEVCPTLDITIKSRFELNNNNLDALFNNKVKDKFYNNKIVICLNENNKCISSITLDSYNNKSNIMSINSFTLEDKRGFKYNKLLRIATVLIANSIRCFQKQENETILFLKSIPINKISAQTLIKYFNVKIELFYANNTSEIININDSNRDNEEIKDKLRLIYDKFYDARNNNLGKINLFNIYIDLKQNYEKSKILFDETLSFIKCDKSLLNGGYIKSKNKKTKNKKTKNKKSKSKKKKLKS